MTASDPAKDFDDWLAAVHGDIVASLEHHLDDVPVSAHDEATALGETTSDVARARRAERAHQPHDESPLGSILAGAGAGLTAEPVPATDAKISVVIVEDHPLFRKELRAQFDTDPAIEVVAEFDTAAEAVREILKLRPSVVLMDLRLPWTAGARATYCGVKAITQIRQAWPEANIAMITMSDDKERVHEAIKAGARSYISKDGEPHDVIPVVRLTAQGITVLNRRASELVAGLLPASMHGSTWFAELGTRENEQLALAAAGDSDRQIAGKLGIAPKTVANNWTNIRQKLRVTARADAVKLARANDFRTGGESSRGSGELR